MRKGAVMVEQGPGYLILEAQQAFDEAIRSESNERWPDYQGFDLAVYSRSVRPKLDRLFQQGCGEYPGVRALVEQVNKKLRQSKLPEYEPPIDVQ